MAIIDVFLEKTTRRFHSIPYSFWVLREGKNFVRATSSGYTLWPNSQRASKWQNPSNAIKWAQKHHISVSAEFTVLYISLEGFKKVEVECLVNATDADRTTILDAFETEIVSQCLPAPIKDSEMLVWRESGKLKPWFPSYLLKARSASWNWEKFGQK